MKTAHIELIVNHVAGILSNYIMKGNIPNDVTIEVLIRKETNLIFPGALREHHVEAIKKHVQEGTKRALEQMKKMTEDQTKLILQTLADQVLEGLPDDLKAKKHLTTDEISDFAKPFVTKISEGMAFNDEEWAYLISLVQTKHVPK